jgi:hypothetical protein
LVGALTRLNEPNLLARALRRIEFPDVAASQERGPDRYQENQGGHQGWRIEEEQASIQLHRCLRRRAKANLKVLE